MHNAGRVRSRHVSCPLVFATLVRWSDARLATVEAARQDYDAAARPRPG